MSDKLYNVGMYIRLSREATNYRGEESLSIENQKTMLSKFITMMPGWIEKRTYIDNGASGANFNRQGFQDMMEDVRQGIINLVLVKDLSRFGRNYLEAGKYLEEELPALGCRFVALSDGIDTETGENDIVPFLNAINDFYVKNLSDRIKSVFTAKAKDGQKVSGIAPYGYDRSPEENNRLIVDEYAAGVVRRIFEARARGVGYAAIAGILNKEKIIPPRLYYFKRKSRKTKAACADMWSLKTVKLILHNNIYIGQTVSFKRKTRSCRDRREVKCDESEWIRVENTHMPIINIDLWQAVQQINKDGKESFTNNRKPQQSLFSGIVVCADCHSNMGYVVSTSKYNSGRVAKYGGYDCRTYRRSGGTVCSWHKISERSLKDLVLERIKKTAELIEIDEERMLKELKQRLFCAHKVSKIGMTKERRELEQQLYSIESQMEKLYEDKVCGAISADTFTAATSKTEAQRLEIEDRLSVLKQSAKQTEAKYADLKMWGKLIKEKSTIHEVDRELLECLIEKVEIGEREAINGVETQCVRIFYKYAGLR